jgi:hypothetical protein
MKSVTVPAFLWTAHAQSGFREDIRRMKCDHKTGLREADGLNVKNKIVARDKLSQEIPTS